MLGLPKHTENLNVTTNNDLTEFEDLVHVTTNEPNRLATGPSNTEFETDERLTKAGNLRKRKRFINSKNERKEIKRKKVINKHHVKQPCLQNCKHKCGTIICTNRQIEINDQYWELPSPHDRKSFVLSSVSRRPVNRRTTFDPNSRRSFTNDYFLIIKKVHQCRYVRHSSFQL